MRKFKKRTLNELADMICGNEEAGGHFKYRSSSYLTEFFQTCDLEQYEHDGSTRKRWVADCLEDILNTRATNNNLLPDGMILVVRELMDKADATEETHERLFALNQLNTSLNREGFDAFYDDHNICQVRNIETQTTSIGLNTAQRAWTAEERKTIEKLNAYMDTASEDAITEEMLLPLYRQLGFKKITPAGHKDKALEYGKDVWMKYTLPTLHILYFGIQVKKGKLDAAGKLKGSNTNIAEIHNQTLMMLGHEIFDPDTNKRALVDHAIIVAGGEITKQARNWLGQKLDASQRSQILFMERNDIIELFLTHNLPLPESIAPKEKTPWDFTDDIPF